MFNKPQKALAKRLTCVVFVAALMPLMIQCNLLERTENRSSRSFSETQQRAEPSSERSDVIKVLREVQAEGRQSWKRHLADGPFEEKELIFLWGAAQTLDEQATEEQASDILFFARDADPLFDMYRALTSESPERYQRAKRFFINFDLYRDTKKFRNYLGKVGLKPGVTLLLVDTGFGGSNISYVIKELVELGAKAEPALSPVQVIFPLHPFLVSSSCPPTWERDFYFLRESPPRTSEFLNDVCYPEILIPETLWNTFKQAGGDRVELVHRLENRDVAQKWEFRPESWGEDNLPLLVAKPAEKRVQVLQAQRQMAAWVLSRRQNGAP